MLLLKYFNLLVIHIFFILKYTLHIGLKTSKIKFKSGRLLFNTLLMFTIIQNLE